MAARSAVVPDLGVGVGLRVPHLRTVLTEQPAVDFFELISENFMVGGGPPLRTLDAVCERYPVVLHGVSMGLGSAEPLDREHLAGLVALQRRTGAPWVSEHLCWSRHGSAHLHDLLPLPHTEAVARFVADKAAFVQDRLGVPFALENLSSYVGFAGSQLPEWDFLREVVERAGCFLLLDVNNIWVSSVDHGFDPQQYLAAVPWERVIQVHLAGHSVRPDGTLLDTHDRPVCDEVWQLYAQACRLAGGVSTLLEWDAHLPSFAETLAEADKARAFRDAARDRRVVEPGPGRPEPAAPPGLAELQGAFARTITTPLRIEPDGYSYQVERFAPAVLAEMTPGPVLSGQARLCIYNQQYWFRLLEVAQQELPLLRQLLGLRGLNELVTAYLVARPSRHPGLHRLLEELPAHLADQPALVRQAAEVDLAWQRVFFAARLDLLDPATMAPPELAALAERPLVLQPALALVAEDWNLVELRALIPSDPDDRLCLPEPRPGRGWWAIHRAAGGVAAERLGEEQHALLRRLVAGEPLVGALEGLAEEIGEVRMAAVAAGIRDWFARWAHLGWFAAPSRR